MSVTVRPCLFHPLTPAIDTVPPLISNWTSSCEAIETAESQKVSSDAWTTPSPQMSFVWSTLIFLKLNLLAAFENLVILQKKNPDFLENLLTQGLPFCSVTISWN